MYMRMSMGGTQLGLHGPASLAGFARASRFFLGKENVDITTPREFGNGGSLPVYKDENIAITTLELHARKDFVGPSSSDSDPDSEPEAKRAKCDSPELPPRSDSVAAFICKLVDVPGKFNPQRAVELGLRPGPAYRDLVRGESVTAPGGRVVRPEDVMGPKQIGPSFVVVECPRMEFIPSITNHPLLQNDTFIHNDQPLALLVHMAPPDVLRSERYSAWISSFGPETKHLFLGRGVCPNEVGFRSILKLQTPLHLMNPLVHCLPAALLEEQGTDQLGTIFQKVPKESIVVGKVLLKYHLKPVAKAGVDESDILGSGQEAVVEELKEIQSNPKLAKAVLHPGTTDRTEVSSATGGASLSGPNLTDEEEKSLVGVSGKEQSSASELAKKAEISLSNLVTQLYQQPQQSPLRHDDVVISFPGTGASCPSKYRNVSGILIQVPLSGNLLFDCGEGTLSQIYKTFGQGGGDAVIQDLKAIFISHIHGDHHLGTVGVLQRRAELLAQERVVSPGGRGQHREMGRKARTVIIGPPMYGQWLREYNQMCERVPYKFLYAEDLLKAEDKSLSASTESVLRDQLVDFSFQTVPVVHCKKAYGVVVEHKTGWKIVYSGDTRPCPELAEAGRNANLLIHEATFEDELQSDAEAKKHCTISEALGIARQMNPDFTILTHFSQRYPMVSPALLNGDLLKARVGMAFDCMSVRLSQVHSLPTFLPAMKEIFAVFSDVEDSAEPGVSWSWL